MGAVSASLPQEAKNYILANPEMEPGAVVLNLTAKGLKVTPEQVDAFWRETAENTAAEERRKMKREREWVKKVPQGDTSKPGKRRGRPPKAAAEPVKPDAGKTGKRAKRADAEGDGKWVVARKGEPTLRERTHALVDGFFDGIGVKVGAFMEAVERAAREGRG